MAVVVVAIAAVTSGHYLTPQSLFLWHNIFQRLYYLPIVYAAIIFGWQGGLAAAVASEVCYIPHILMMWRGLPEYSTSQFAEIVVFPLVGILAGVLGRSGAKAAAGVTAERRQTGQGVSRAARQL